MTGFEKLSKLITKKNSHVVLGLDPNDEEMAEGIKEHGDLEKYLKWLIDETQEFIVGIKPNLAFYEKDPERRSVMMNIMRYAKEKHGLVTIMDAKRGDIANTQKEWAKADIKNFEPDIVTLSSYLGCEDVIKPYLDADPNVCVYSLVATSNPSSEYSQNVRVGGIYYYQYMALQARKIDENRVGFVIGSTKVDAMKNVRTIELEHGYDNNFAHVLAPGFGRQGGDLEFVEHAGKNSVYPISSGLTNRKYLNGQTPKEAAKNWRNQINERLANAKHPKSIKDKVVEGLINDGLIIIPKSEEIYTWPILKIGRDKLDANEIPYKDLTEKDRMLLFKEKLEEGVLSVNDFTTLFLNIRNVIGTTETRRLLAYLYSKAIEDSKVEYDSIGSVAYGAITMGSLVADYLDKPGFMLRKTGEEANHGRLIGCLHEGENVIMIEDVITSAGSLIENVDYLRKEIGVKIKHAFIFCQRTPEGRTICEANGITLHPIMTMNQLREHICNLDSVSKDVKKLILGR